MAEQLYVIVGTEAYAWSAGTGMQVLHYVAPSYTRANFKPADTDGDGLAEAAYDHGNRIVLSIDYPGPGAVPGFSFDQLPSAGPSVTRDSRPYLSQLVPWELGLAYSSTQDESVPGKTLHHTPISLLGGKGADGRLLYQEETANRTGSSGMIAEGNFFVGAGRFGPNGEVKVLHTQNTLATIKQDIYMDGTLVLNGVDPATYIVGIGNYFGDSGRDEILFKNFRDNSLVIWDPTKGSEGFRALFTPTKGWDFVTSGDLTGDGIEDLVLSYYQPFGEQATTVEGATAYYDFVNNQWGWIGAFEKNAIRGVAQIFPTTKSSGAEIEVGGIAAETPWDWG